MDDGPDEDVRHHDVHLPASGGKRLVVASVRQVQIQATLHAVQRRVSARRLDGLFLHVHPDRRLRAHE